MPEISRFYGIVVSMFYDDHNPPHFHVQYGEFKAVIRINDFALMDGNLPPKAIGLVIEWANIHKKELIENWELAVTDQQLNKIAPLI
jgi:hypothetical protein